MNPKQGYLVQWNERPSKEYKNNERQNGWGTAHRVKILDDYMKARPKVDLSTMTALNRLASFQDPIFNYFKSYIINAVRKVEPDNTKLAEAAALLESWDGQRVDNDGDQLYDHPAQTIFEEWLPVMLEKTFRDEFKDYFSLLDFKYPESVLGRSFTVPLGVNVLLYALQGKEAGVPPSRDYFNGVDPNAVIVNSLKDALSKLESKYGTADMSKWRRGVNMLRFGTTNVFGIPQSLLSVKDVLYMNRGTQNHVVILGKDRVRGWNVVPPGQSGFVNLQNKTSPHYQDQLDLYVKFEYKPMLFTKQEVEGAAESKTILPYQQPITITTTVTETRTATVTSTLAQPTTTTVTSTITLPTTTTVTSTQTKTATVTQTEARTVTQTATITTTRTEVSTTTTIKEAAVDVTPYLLTIIILIVIIIILAILLLRRRRT